MHVADRREPERHPADRVLPGDGVANLPELLGALERAGWHGHYEIEIFSDESLADSLWRLEPAEFAARARSAFDRVWDARAG